MSTTEAPSPADRGSGSNDLLGLVPERTYTRTQLLAAIEAERHACSIAVWMTLQDALAEDADDKGLDGWLREAEQRVKNRSVNDPDVRKRPPLNDAQALELARKHLDKGLSWAPHITRCTDLEIRALIRAVEAAHGIEA